MSRRQDEAAHIPTLGRPISRNSKLSLWKTSYLGSNDPSSYMLTTSPTLHFDAKNSAIPLDTHLALRLATPFSSRAIHDPSHTILKSSGSPSPTSSHLFTSPRQLCPSSLSDTSLPYIAHHQLSKSCVHTHSAAQEDSPETCFSTHHVSPSVPDPVRRTRHLQPSYLSPQARWSKPGKACPNPPWTG
jgi:hypothetical protein